MTVTDEKYAQLVDFTKKINTVDTAVVHPCKRYSLKATVEAAQLGVINPILCGPEARIRAAADEAEVDISGFELISTEHSHDSAAQAVQLVHQGRAACLMKGSLHTDELMGAVVSRSSGLRTERRISHCFVMDVPSYNETLILSDAAINIAPTLDDKVDIIKNAIDLGLALKFDQIRVAILSAMETVSSKVPSTIEAAALCKMADRKQITGATLDGPLAMDNAINIQAANIKQIDSPVAGRANVLIAPDLEAGNMLAKSLSFLANAQAAGIVMGARVPIILTSRADSHMARMASCSVAALVAEYRKQQETQKIGLPAGV